MTLYGGHFGRHGRIQRIEQHADEHSRYLGIITDAPLEDTKPVSSSILGDTFENVTDSKLLKKFTVGSTHPNVVRGVS